MLADFPLPAAPDSGVGEHGQQAVRLLGGRGEQRMPQIGRPPVAQLVADDEVREHAPRSRDVRGDDFQMRSGLSIADEVLHEPQVAADPGIRRGQSLDRSMDQPRLVTIRCRRQTGDQGPSGQQNPGDLHGHVRSLGVTPSALDVRSPVRDPVRTHISPASKIPPSGVKRLEVRGLPGKKTGGHRHGIVGTKQEAATKLGRRLKDLLAEPVTSANFLEEPLQSLEGAHPVPRPSASSDLQESRAIRLRPATPTAGTISAGTFVPKRSLRWPCGKVPPRRCPFAAPRPDAVRDETRRPDATSPVRY